MQHIARELKLSGLQVSCCIKEVYQEVVTESCIISGFEKIDAWPLNSQSLCK